MIEAFARTKCKDSVKLYLCGAGELDINIKNRINELNLSQCIKNLGFKSNIWSYMKSAEFIISPSRWEGFSMTLIDALACDTPVMTTRTGGAEEIIKDGENGFFIKTNDVVDTAKIIDKAIYDSKIVKNNCLSSVKHLDIFKYKQNVFSALS